MNGLLMSLRQFLSVGFGAIRNRTLHVSKKLPLFVHSTHPEQLNRRTTGLLQLLLRPLRHNRKSHALNLIERQQNGSLHQLPSRQSSHSCIVGSRMLLRQILRLREMRPCGRKLTHQSPRFASNSLLALQMARQQTWSAKYPIQQRCTARLALPHVLLRPEPIEEACP